MDKKERRCWIALGGLLHDIGKIIQRAGLGREYDAKEFKYSHACYTYGFLEEVLSGKVGQEVKELILSGAYHHKPREGNIHDLVQQMADWCASSERSRKRKDHKLSKGKRLISIFSVVGLSEESKNRLDRLYYHRLIPLEISEDVLFPKEQMESQTEEEYRRLFEGFKKGLESVQFKNCQKALLKIYYLAYKYLWSVPASTYDLEHGTSHFSDISLFDHLRVASALASALITDYNKKVLESNKKLEDLKFVLVEGDLTGIQKFLYGVANTEGVGRRLRGRSFFLAVLPYMLGRFFLEELEYPMVNLLYAGGGKFQLLLGYEEGIENTLESLAQRVDRALIKEFEGQLGLVVGHLVLSGEDLGVDRLGEKIQELYQKVGERKFRKFAGVMEEFYSLVDSPEGKELCPSCKSLWKKEEEEFCSWCKAFQEVGWKIPRAKYLVFSREEGDLYLEGIGGVKLLEDRKLLEDEEKIVLLINQTDFEGRADGFFFLAKTVPMQNGNVLDFNQMVEEEKGYKLLGFLKADVDNLGLVFSQGLKEEYSLSRVATLSRSLDLFFSGYLNHFFEEEFKNKVYTVYSGGDDLMVCAEWETSLELAIKLKQKFDAYTCYNPDFSLSVGIFLQKPNFPIRFGAEEAEEEKERAKVKKPAVSIMKTPLKWDEFEAVLKDTEEFLKDFPAKDHRTLIYRIFQMLKAHKYENQINLRFYPLFYYQIYRNVEEKHRRSIERFIINEDYSIKPNAELALKLVIMKTRG